MVDLGRLEEQLKTDAAFRAEFFRDPVGVMRKAGLWLSLAQQHDLRMAVARDQIEHPYIVSPTSSNLQARGYINTWRAWWRYG